MALDPLGKARLGKIGGLLGKGNSNRSFTAPAIGASGAVLSRFGQVQG